MQTTSRSVQNSAETAVTDAEGASRPLSRRSAQIGAVSAQVCRGGATRATAGNKGVEVVGMQNCAEANQSCADNGASDEGRRHFLTPGDLRVLTGYSHHGRQRTILDRHGIKYVLRANDSIVTTWGAVEAALTRTTEAPARRRRDI